VNKYQKFKKMDNKSYSDVTRFLKETTHLTAREWVTARLCADFKNLSNQSEMTWIGENLPALVPFMDEGYSRQEVSNARSSFKKKIQRSGSTFFYAYYAGLITQDEMITIIHKIVVDIKKLMNTEGSEVPEEHATDVQILIADVLRKINESLDEDY
jgi:arsenate reductase-like glutaredoxin family protein